MTITETGLKEREASPSGDALEARDVRVVFGDATVLNSATASVRPGEIVGIVGPNGSGKTTLLRAMAGLIRPASGEVLLGNRPLSEISPRQRASIIGYLPQSTANHSFTASEFVLMGRYPHIGRFSLEGRRDRELAAEAMERTGTIEFASRRLEEMSGGERQRVALARLLAQQARYLLLDEPTSSLDMQHQQLTMETAREEADSGAGVAVVLHDLSLAARHCDRLILIHSGSVVAEGEPWDVITRDNLRRFFSVNAAVEPEPISGRPGVSLLDVADDDAVNSPLRVHIVCGAGSGRDLMHRFASEGHSVTACVLGEGDADRETANRLGIQHVAAPPFSSITLEQDAENRRLVRQADVVVVCDMAVGPGNLRNLEAATEANALVLIDHPLDAEWDYTDGAATEVRNQLSTRAKVVTREQVLKVVSASS